MKGPRMKDLRVQTTHGSRLSTPGTVNYTEWLKEWQSRRDAARLTVGQLRALLEPLDQSMLVRFPSEDEADGEYVREVTKEGLLLP